jgi:2,5-diketo-D-gluconate reductase B
MGYRLVDTAQLYGNEAAVGDGIARADVPREDVLVATKVSEERLAYEDVHASVEESLERLGVETIDLLYVHWPINAYEPGETLRAFDELYDDDVIRYVGVSNFSAEQTDEAVDYLDAPLVANQVEMHPLLPPREAHLKSARTHGYQLVAYSPFGRGDVFGNEAVEAVAEKHGVSQAQVCLAWLWTYDDVAAIPKGTSEAHLRDNYEALSLELDDGDVARIEAIEERHRRFDNREGAPWKQQ